MSDKEMVLEALQQLPYETSLPEIVEFIALLAALREGEADADAGRLISHEEMRRRISQWTD